MRRSALAFGAAAALLCAVSAQAAPISFGVTAYTGSGGGTISSPYSQALPSNPLISGATTEKLTFDSAGSFPYFAAPPAANTLGGLIGGFGSVSNVAYHNGAVSTDALSTSGFGISTLVVADFTVSRTISGIIGHDDGISLYQGSTQLIDASAPTTLADTPFAVGPGSYTLYYVEANGAPADLQFLNVAVSEPPGIALFATALAGMLGLTMLQRRQRR